MPKMKDIKRQEAVERNEYYQSLSTEDKIRHIAGRPGFCKRQLIRLTTLLGVL